MADMPEVQTLLERLKLEKESKLSGGIYHRIQIELTYNSNHMEGSSLTHDQTRYIFETNTLSIETKSVNADDVVETMNHFRCIDFIIDCAEKTITEEFIKEIHYMLKNGTTDSRKSWFVVGDYKILPNEVGGMETTSPENVSEEIQSLLKVYNADSDKTLEDLLDFHYKFERIHPFQDDDVIIRTKLEKPSKIKGLALI